MRYPWVNTLLLVLIPLAIASGYFGLTNGDPGRAWILGLHAAAAYAIVVVVAWKVAVIRRSLERKPLGTPGRPVFLFMAALLGFVLLSGIAWAWLGRATVAGTSLLTLHGLAAAVVAIVFIVHVLDSRVVFRVRRARDRRAFLRLAVAGAAGVAVWQAGLLAMRLFDLSGRKRRFTGSYETASYTSNFPAVSWLFDAPAPVSKYRWHLRVDGHVETPADLTYDGLLGLPQATHTAVLDCTGGWYTQQQWSGVPLASLLASARPKPGVESVTVTSVTGYSRRFSMDEARTALLALAVAGSPLSDEHGFPARLVVPGCRGFDWVKWVTRVTLNDTSDLWQSPLPLQ